MIIFTICLCVFLYYLYKVYTKDKRNLPPGPFQWPIIGNLVQLARAHPVFPHLAMGKLSKKYGDVMTLKFGVHNAVVLSSFEAIRDLLGRDEFADRYEGFAFAKDRSFHKLLGIIFQNGEAWRNLRRYTVRTLRDFGFGKRNSMSAIFEDELAEFMATLQPELTKTGGILSIEPELFAGSFVNLLWCFVAGQRFSHSDPKLKRIIKMNDDVIKSLDFSNIAVPFPKLRFMFPEYTNYNHQMKIFTELQDFIRDLINKIKLEYEQEVNGNPRSYIEAFIHEMKISDGKSDSVFTEQQLIMVLKDLFLGGSETTSNTFTYALLYMILYPDIQKRVQEEISSVSHDGLLTLADLPKMPYTDATMQEIFRITHIVPMPIPKSATTDVTYRNYVIPKGFAVFFNLSAVMMDKEYWGDPEAFRPERFLDSTQTKVINTERLLPFGYGKRVCIAESLARDSFFMYFTTFLKTYSFSIVPGTERPPTDPLTNFTLRPATFKALVTLR